MTTIQKSYNEKPNILKLLRDILNENKVGMPIPNDWTDEKKKMINKENKDTENDNYTTTKNEIARVFHIDDFADRFELS